MKNALLTAALMLSALGARADSLPQMVMGGDPLSRQILTKTAQPNGGVTAAVRVAGSVQGIQLNLADPSANALSAALSPAAATPEAALKPVEELAPKAVPVKAKKPPRRATDQLKHVVEKKAWGR